MKLRIRANSLRLRLTRTEVVRLAADGVCSETMQLAHAVLTYEVRTDLAISSPVASLEGSTLTVTVPSAIVAAWSRTETVSIRAEDGPLAILIEKDFACLQPREGEDDADTYPNPLQPIKS